MWRPRIRSPDSTADRSRRRPGSCQRRHRPARGSQGRTDRCCPFHSRLDLSLRSSCRRSLRRRRRGCCRSRCYRNCWRSRSAPSRRKQYKPERRRGRHPRMPRRLDSFGTGWPQRRRSRPAPSRRTRRTCCCCRQPHSRYRSPRPRRIPHRRQRRHSRADRCRRRSHTSRSQSKCRSARSRCMPGRQQRRSASRTCHHRGGSECSSRCSRTHSRHNKAVPPPRRQRSCSIHPRRPRRRWRRHRSCRHRRRCHPRRFRRCRPRRSRRCPPMRSHPRPLCQASCCCYFRNPAAIGPSCPLLRPHTWAVTSKPRVDDLLPSLSC